jgi:hypothetical protein
MLRQNARATTQEQSALRAVLTASLNACRPLSSSGYRPLHGWVRTACARRLIDCKQPESGM